MANYLATYFSNGTNRASFMNAIKLAEDNRTLTLYSTDNDKFESSVTLPDPDLTKSKKTEEPIDGTMNVGIMITDNDRMEDCTADIQDVIDELSAKGGGVIHLGRGVYPVTNLVMKARVSLVGSGEGVTVLKRVPKSSASQTLDAFYSGGGFITIPVNAAGLQIKDMTIFGSAEIEGTTNRSLQISGITSYTDNRRVNGIQILESPVVCTTKGGNSTNPYKIHTGTYDSEEELDFSDLTPYKFIRLENLTVCGFSGSGIVIGANNSNISIHNVNSNMNRYAGIIFAGDNLEASNIDTTGNGATGIYNAGTANKFNNIKSQYNGKFDHSASYGIYSIGDKAVFSNIECNFNWCTGLKIESDYNIINNLMVDNNGARSSHDPNGANPNPKDVSQVFITGNYHRIYGIIMNTNATSTVKVASRGLECDDKLNNSVLNFTLSANAGDSDAYIYPQMAVTNTTINNSTDFGTNIVTVLLV